jgi:hypothetical protein
MAKPSALPVNLGERNTCANSRPTRKAKRPSSILRKRWTVRLERCDKKLWRSVSSWVIGANDTWRARPGSQGRRLVSPLLDRHSDVALGQDAPGCAFLAI